MLFGGSRGVMAVEGDENLRLFSSVCVFLVKRGGDEIDMQRSLRFFFFLLAVL